MKLTDSHWEGWRRAMLERWGDEVDYPSVCPMFGDVETDQYPEEDFRIPADHAFSHEMKLAWRQLDGLYPEIAYAVRVFHGLGKKPRRWTHADLDDYAAEGMRWIEVRVGEITGLHRGIAAG